MFTIHLGKAEGLCRTCSHGHTTEFTNGKVVTICLALRGMKVPSPVLSCTEYVDRNMPDKWDMEKVAWVVRTDRSGKVLGFGPPAKERD